MKKLSLLFILLLVLSTTLLGCNNELPETEKENLVGLNTSYEYALTMSSVPGLPLEFSVNSNEDTENLIIRVAVDSGRLLQWDWENTGDIKFIGDDISLEFKDQTIYWAPHVDDSSIQENNATLLVYLIDNTTNEIISTESYLILNDNGNYKIIHSFFYK